jgi:hypothetical protein
MLGKTKNDNSPSPPLQEAAVAEAEEEIIRQEEHVTFLRRCVQYLKKHNHSNYMVHDIYRDDRMVLHPQV